jgi:hypothetical protein
MRSEWYALVGYVAHVVLFAITQIANQQRQVECRRSVYHADRHFCNIPLDVRRVSAALHAWLGFSSHHTCKVL